MIAIICNDERLLILTTKLDDWIVDLDADLKDQVGVVDLVMLVSICFPYLPGSV